MTPYAKQNGGKFDFIVEKEYAMPQDLVSGRNSSHGLSRSVKLQSWTVMVSETLVMDCLQSETLDMDCLHSETLDTRTVMIGEVVFLPVQLQSWIV